MPCQHSCDPESARSRSRTEAEQNCGARAMLWRIRLPGLRKGDADIAKGWAVSWLPEHTPRCLRLCLPWFDGNASNLKQLSHYWWAAASWTCWSSLRPPNPRRARSLRIPCACCAWHQFLSRAAKLSSSGSHAQDPPMEPASNSPYKTPSQGLDHGHPCISLPSRSCHPFADWRLCLPNPRGSWNWRSWRLCQLA